MTPTPCFSEPLDRRTHDALFDWLRANYGAADDWCTLYLNGVPLGRLNPVWRERIRQDWQDGFSRFSDDVFLQTDGWLAMGDSLQHLAHEWKRLGLLHGWRDERFDVCGADGGVLFPLERAAFRPFGLMSRAVHLNGLVRTAGGWQFWIGRRSPHKAVDPDKLDNLVGGGIASGETPFEAVCRESEEEAGLTDEHFTLMHPCAEIHSLRPVSRGIHNEILYIYDIVLPETVHPENQDGEVAGFERMDVPQLIDAMLAQTMMHDAQLVTLDAFRRYGLLDAAHPLTARLEGLLHTTQPPVHHS